MRVLRLAAVTAALLSLQGCWFVFIPGSVTSAIADGITGARGENCVSERAAIGDRVTLPNGGMGTIKGLYGTSSRCTQPGLPIRAEIAI